MLDPSDWITLFSMAAGFLASTGYLAHRFGKLETRVDYLEAQDVDTKDRLRTNELDVATLKARRAAA